MLSPLQAGVAMGALYAKNTVFRVRSLLIVALVGIDLLGALIFRANPEAQDVAGALDRLTRNVLFGFVLPFIALHLGTSVVRDEAESGTLPYLLGRPISRASFLFGRTFAAFLTLWCVVIGTHVLNILIVGEGEASPVAMGAALTLGALAYTTLFTTFGAVFKRPFLFGMIWLLGFELWVSQLPFTARFATIRGHFENVAGFSPEVLGLKLFESDVSTVTSVVTCLVTSGVAIVIGLVIFSRREFNSDG